MGSEKIKDKSKKNVDKENEAKKMLESVGQYVHNGIGGKNNRSTVTPLYAYSVLERITPEDTEWLGFKFGMRPEHFIITVLPITPPSVRPSVQMDSSRRGEDDLTYKYTEVIRANNNLREQIETESTGGKKIDHWSLLQFHVATLLDNDVPKYVNHLDRCA